MNFVEADMHNAFVEVLREDLGKAYVDMQEIVGGIGPASPRVLRASCGIGSASAPRSTRWTRTSTA